jgi:polar amino acid transport system substrate-binding protein
MHRGCLAFLVAVLLATASPGQTAEPSACPRPYTLALHEHGLLYSADTDRGIDKDTVDQLVERSGCKIIVSLMPRARIWQLIETGALDFSLSGITNDERDQYAAFAWYFADKYYLLVRKDLKATSIDDFQRAAKFQLGVIRGFRYSPNANRLVDTLQADQRVVFATTLDPLYTMLLAGRIQGMIIEPFDYPALQEASIREATQLLEFNDPAVPHGLIMSRKGLSDAEQNRWRAIIASMKSDGTFLRIFQTYFPEAMANSMVNY